MLIENDGVKLLQLFDRRDHTVFQAPARLSCQPVHRGVVALSWCCPTRALWGLDNGAARIPALHPSRRAKCSKREGEGAERKLDLECAMFIGRIWTVSACQPTSHRILEKTSHTIMTHQHLLMMTSG
jgi:hypothetical protein